MKTITIDNQEYELVPIYNYKEGDWIIFQNGGVKPIIRKIISDKEYDSVKNNVGETLDFKYGDWMTFNASKSYIKDIVRKATHVEIHKHLEEMAKQKGLVKGAKVKRLSVLDNSTFVTIVQEDDDYYFEQDEYCKSGIILYSKGEWVSKIEESKFTFGGNEVEFKKIPSNSRERQLAKIEVICKGETGTHLEIENILKYYFRPCKFGNVEVKSFTWTNSFTGNKVEVIREKNDLYAINDITIGCLTGKYKELYDIYNHCLTLLK